jgi:hypothetical protein
MKPTIIDWTDGKQYIPNDNSFPNLDKLLEKSKKRPPNKLWICPWPWPDTMQIIFAVSVGVVGASLFVAGVGYKIYLLFFA